MQWETEGELCVRPGLHEFLKQVHGFADLVLFTAGLEGYARPLVDRIDVENLFSFRVYRPSTTSTEYREHVKDLSSLSKGKGRIVIVDNNPFSFLLQPLNGIPCIPFSAGQIHDTQRGRSNFVNSFTLNTSAVIITYLPLRRLFVSFPFNAPFFFSFWMFFFHCSSTYHCRKT